MPYSALRYTRCVVVVHGKCEAHIVRYIYTNLRLPVKLLPAKKSGKGLEITDLLNYMSKPQFSTLENFADKYTIEYDKKNKKLKNFKLFIIMDTEDYNEKIKNDYITGKMFNRHILKDYIVPIYNISTLEEVLVKSGIMKRKISKSEKGKYYAKVFPINKESLSNDTIAQVNAFAVAIRNVKETNMLKFINYCLSIVYEIRK